MKSIRSRVLNSRGLLILLISFFLSRWLTQKIHPGADDGQILMGWGVAFIFNLIGLKIKKSAIGMRAGKFFIFSIVLNGLNLALLFATIIAIRKMLAFDTSALIFSIVVAYINFLFYDIGVLRYRKN